MPNGARCALACSRAQRIGNDLTQGSDRIPRVRKCAGELTLAHCVIVGSGLKTREIVADSALMSSLHLDPRKQLVDSHCSGALILAKLGLLDGIPACTDTITKPWVQEAGVEVLNQPFYAKGNLATAGGCLASQYLAAWVIARLDSMEAADSALRYVAPVGEKDEYVDRALRNIRPFLGQ